MMIKISACLMVKDEEANLERCLKSIKNFVDEIVVVDTGSTDKTMEIAKKYGAKVFEHPWENDFSLHRNQSIKYATGDWILIIDADEELFLEDSVEAIKQTLEKDIPKNIGGISIDLKDIQKNKCEMIMNSYRLFRKGKISYSGIVHNKAVIGGEGCFLNGLYLNHYGYDLTPEQQEKKKLRTSTLLFKRVEENENDFEAMFYLIQLFAVLNDNIQTSFWAERYLQTCTNLNQKMKESVYFTVYRCYYALQDKVNAEKWLMLGLKNTEDVLDLCLAMVEYGVWNNSFDLVINGARRFAYLYSEIDKNPEKKNNLFVFSFKPECLLYCFYCYSLYCFQQAAENLINFENLSKIVPAKNYVQELIDSLNINLVNLGIAPIDQILTTLKTKNEKNN